MAWLGTLVVVVILALPEAVPVLTGIDIIPHGTFGHTIGRTFTAFVLAAGALKSWNWLQDDMPTHPNLHAHINWSALCIGTLSWVISFIK